MDNVTQQLQAINQQISATEALSQHSADDLLSAFLSSYNQQNADWDALISENAKLEQQLEGYKRQCHEQQKELDQVKHENKECRQIALDAEKLGHNVLGLTRERAVLKDQVKALQAEIKNINATGNPKKLKEQIKRLKEKDSEQKKRIANDTHVLKQSRTVLKTYKEEITKLEAEVVKLNKELCHNTGSGLYHNGDHHLIIWPQITKMQREDGSIFDGRSLLYLHQSGRGGLMTFDPESGTHLCASPRGGLRPSSECVEFANDWLYKVNVLQKGTVKEMDMMPVNYNADTYAEIDG
ncbi:hypothetical protein [Photobacterium leiognathi]|uniref:hypothetical protein n=1 Tax=Photobacterium leiognathi TaxID=553611 RepID=UPI000D1659AC|nr:hypothetical protein [Photobacterium leiognathi]PSW53049.1 hypothetical protein C0W50_19770 [Photobacterium leiognathi subsp. mandapamensis]